jgi:outer membrane protein OmpA-like peptidoglycan-associated protein
MSAVGISPDDPNTLVVQVATNEITLSTVSSTGEPIVPEENTLTILSNGDQIKFGVQGFKPKTEVAVYMFSTPTFVGKVVTDENGNYASALPAPNGLRIGMHTIQLGGYLEDGSLATLSLPVVVKQALQTKTLKVYFNMGSEKVTATQGKLLTEALAKINKKKIKEIVIKGFVQKTLAQINDEKLPRLRAIAVGGYLKKLGITTKPTISSGGYATEKDWRARRVEIVLKIAK